MSDDNTIATLNNILLRLNQTVPIICLVAGTLGHICNILIFSKRSQQANPISLFFLSNTVSSLVVLYIGLLVRYFQDTWNLDPVNNNLIVCRIRSFLLYSSLSLSNWYILLATIDRYLISSESHTRRQLSNIKNAYRTIAFVTILSILFYCHILILYNIQTSVNSSNHLQNFCYPQRGPYRTFSDSQLLVQFSLLPPLLMSIFVVYILRNIHASHKRVVNIVVAQHHIRLRKRDMQLSKMLLLQVIITIVCSLPLALSQLSTTMTLTWTKTTLRLTVEGFISQLGRHLAFFNCSISFYLYTLAGSQFRSEIRQIINRLTMLICHHRLLGARRVDIELEVGARKAHGSAPQQNTPPKTDPDPNRDASIDTRHQI